MSGMKSRLFFHIRQFADQKYLDGFKQRVRHCCAVYAQLLSQADCAKAKKNIITELQKKYESGDTQAPDESCSIGTLA